MNEYFDEPQAFTIPINPPGKREDMIAVIDPVELTVKSDDECHRPENTASTSLSDVQESVAPTRRLINQNQDDQIRLVMTYHGPLFYGQKLVIRTAIKLTNFSPSYLKEATALRLSEPVLTVEFPPLVD